MTRRVNVEYSTTDYVMSHGKQPRGRGMWAFFADRSMRVEEATWSSPNMTFAEAKREHTQKVRDFVKGVKDPVQHVTVYVGT